MIVLRVRRVIQMLNEMIIGFLIAILLLQFVVYFMNLSALRNLSIKQQSTIYGVSHIWGSIMELRGELEAKLSPNSLENIGQESFLNDVKNIEEKEAIA